MKFAMMFFRLKTLHSLFDNTKLSLSDSGTTLRAYGNFTKSNVLSKTPGGEFWTVDISLRTRRSRF
jgi:hypothetical protein